MRKLLRLGLFSLGLLVLVLGLAWLTQRQAGLPAPALTVTPGSGQAPSSFEPTEPTLPAAANPPAVTVSPGVGLSSGSVEEVPSDLISDPGDPLYNDVPTGTIAARSLTTGAANPRRAHLTFEVDFRNDGPGEVTTLDLYVPLPQSRDNQRISNLSFSVPYTSVVDRYGEEMAHIRVIDLAPGQEVKVVWQGDVEIEAMDYRIDPEKVAELGQIPPDIAQNYTSNEAKYRLESQVIQDAASRAGKGATNPYWIARNVHDFVARRLSYANDGQWDDAEAVYLQRTGSCSEYTFLFVSLCRANGLPARYVAGTRQRIEGTYVDTVFHRWAEVYLPPYGWVPIDALHDDRTGSIRYDYFGAISDERFATTVSGGDSEYLGWNYHYGYRYDHRGDRPVLSRTRRFTWEPYPSELRVSPDSVSGFSLPATDDALVGTLDIMTTNGSYDWSVESITNWLWLDKAEGVTPDAVQVFADTTGLEPGLHTGQVVFQSKPLGGTITIPVNVSVMEELPTPSP
jgi:transglutaminase-like putative cysteine protease